MNSHGTIITAFLGYSLAMLLGCTLSVGDAAAGDEPCKETVTFHDLNLNTASGVEALYTRIHEAAMRVCNEFDPVLSEGMSACILQAEVGAIQRANVPALTAYYRMKTGRRV